MRKRRLVRRARDRNRGSGRGRWPIPLVTLAFLLLGLAPAAGAEPAPDTQITEAKTGPNPILTKRAVAAFRYRSGVAGVRFQCILDESRWRGCRRGFFRRLVGPGEHVFRVRAVDPTGLADPTPAVRKWAVTRWEPDLEAARRYAARRSSIVTFELDLGWRSWSRGAQVRARMASTVKVMLMVAYLRMRSVKGRALSGYERTILSTMIRVSDNNAANLVAAQVGSRRMRVLARRAGMRDFTYSPVWGTSRTSARDQARFMRRIEDLLPERHRAYALVLLSSIVPVQSWGVPKVKPPGWRLFFKGGWGTTGLEVNNQIALLRRGKYRIGLAIMTQYNPYTTYGEETLREVARKLLAGLPAP